MSSLPHTTSVASPASLYHESGGGGVSAPGGKDNPRSAGSSIPPAGAGITHETWPWLDSRFTLEQVTALAETLSKRGKVPGFARAAQGGGFSFTGFGSPIDYRVHVSEGIVPPATTSTVTAADAGNSMGAGVPHRIIASGTQTRKIPVAFALLSVISVWPGIWLTDSMLRTYFDWYRIPTWYWYVPLMILPLPWMYRRMHIKSKAAAIEHAHEVFAELATALPAEKS